MKKTFTFLIITLIHFFRLTAADIIYNTPGAVSVVSSTLNVPDNLIVKRGTFLRITGTVYLSTNSRIIIEQGAVLRLQGGILTSSTNNPSTFWTGIEVRGNGQYPNIPESFVTESYFLNNYNSLNSGVFYSINGNSNAQINFSKYGVVSSEIGASGPTGNSTGGYISCWYTDFNTNLYSSVYIRKSAGSSPSFNNAIIAYNNFTSALSSNIPNVDQFAQIMNNGGNIRVYGNSFSTANYSDNYVVGIRSIAAKTAVFNNSFSNLKSAVMITGENLSGNTSTYSFIEQNSIVYKGNTTFSAINLDNSDLVSVRRNKIFYLTNIKAMAIIGVNASDKNRIENNTFTYSGTVNPNDNSTGIGIYNTALTFGQAYSNIFNNMSTGILVQGKNQGFIFKCNQFNSTRGIDIFILSNNGTVAPVQLAGNISAENIFTPIPTSPSSRTNFITRNTSTIPLVIYNYSSNSPNTNPVLRTLYYIVTFSYKQQKSTCQEPMPRILPNNGDPSKDNSYGISDLGLPSGVQSAYVHNLDILEKAKRICAYLDNDLCFLDSNHLDSLIHEESPDPNFIDSAIGLLIGDTSFAAVYTLSKLYLNNPATIQTALDLVANTYHNNHPEFIQYKVLFPLIVDGLSKEFSPEWFDNSFDELSMLANSTGFIAAQARSILNQYTQSNSILNQLYTSQTYDIDAVCSPNPFSDTLNLTVTNHESAINTLQIEVLDAAGTSKFLTVASISTSTNSIDLNLADLPLGLYTCIISVNNTLIKCLYISKN